MKVLVDGVVFENSFQKGIRRYVHEVLRRSDLDFSLLLQRPLVGTVPAGWNLIEPLGPLAKPMDFLGRWKRRKCFKQRLKSISEHAVFHSTWFRLCPVPGIPTIVTIYDMVSVAMPTRYWGDAAGHFSAKAAAIKAADAIITISETTKQDLLKLFPDIRVEVHAIPLGADHFEISSSNPLQNNFSQGINNESYALFVGDRVGYKNFHSLLEAMCQSEWPRGVRLKVAGPPFSLAEEACLRFMGLQDKVDVCGLVTNDDLAYLYAGATAFVFPSLFEGFGLPLLEAQARHAPVVANDMAIFHEVGGNAFLPCDCRNPALIAKAVSDLTHAGRRESLIQAGLENVKRYTWAETARKTKAVWESVARF